MKAQIYLLITLALFTFLISCGPDDTTPSSSNPSPIYFSLTQGTNTLNLNNSLAYSKTDTYLLTITNSSSQFINSNFYSISYSPSNALSMVATTSNTVSFRVANADLGSVKLTATHSNDNTLTREVTLNLTKAEYSASEIPIAYSPTNKISINGTYPVSPITLDSVANFFPKYPLKVSVSPTLPASISNDGRVYLTTEASVSTNKVTVTFSSSNYVDYTTNFYVQVHSDPIPQAVLLLSSGTAPLTFGGGSYTVTANLTNSDGSKVTGITEDFRFTATPSDAIVVISSTTNSYTFAVTNASYGSVTINTVHQQSNTLSARQRFTLAKRSYPSGIVPIAYSAANNVAASASTPGKISPSSDTRANYYPQGLANLTISRVSGPTTYSFNASTGEITFTGGGSYEFQATFVSSNYATYTTPQFTVTVEQTTRFAQVVQGGSIPNLTSETDELTRAVLTNLGVATGGTLVARYATESGTGTKNGTSWANAWAATDLRGGINGISDASATKAYVVLVARGTYKPTDGVDRNLSFSMKNHTAIVGGFTSAGGWERNGTTTFSGDIGTVGDTADNSYRVFSHTSITLDNGLLYGVAITKANGNGNSGFPVNGGGMYNESSSPRLVNVVFSDNSASVYGGGMYNKSSSPVLTEVAFVSNSSGARGGGMYNERNSSPVLTGGVFTGNSSQNGGGIYNNTSVSTRLMNVRFVGNSARGNGGGVYSEGNFPVLTGVVFTSNSAGANGGGMFNGNGSWIFRGGVFIGNSAGANGGGLYSFSPLALVGVVFTGNSAGANGGGISSSSTSLALIGVVVTSNSAKADGGGMYNDNGSAAGPLIANTIFVGNSASNSASGHDIAMSRNTADGETIRIAGSVLGISLANATNAVVGIGTTGPLNLTYHSLANGAVNFGTDAFTSAATGGLTYPTIESTSSAVDIGLYVQRSGSTYYFSDTGTGATWHTSFAATGGLAGAAVALPGGTEDLTATDIAGNARVGRPDAGVSEYTP